MSRFQLITKQKPKDKEETDLISQDTIYNRVGWRREEEDGMHYYITPEIFKSEVIAGLNVQTAEIALVEAKIMRKRDEGGKLHKVRIGGEQPRLYDLKVPNDE